MRKASNETMSALIPYHKQTGGASRTSHGMCGVATRAAGVTAVLCCLSGCISGPPAAEPAMLENARNLSAQAETSMGEGRNAEACAGYAKALEIYRSTDYGPGIVRALLNLATVRLQVGDRAGARDCLRAARRYEASLEASNPAERNREGMPGLWAEVSWLEARLEADEGRISPAWGALARGYACAGRMPDEQKGRYAAMEARLHLASGEFAQAESSAAKSWSSYHGAGDELGMADALRYRGKALAGQGKHKDALSGFDAALAIDQRHARAPKVRDDLLCMSRSAAATGDMSRAHACAERSAKLASGGGAGER